MPCLIIRSPTCRHAYPFRRTASSSSCSRASTRPRSRRCDRDGYTQVETHPKALAGDELVDAIRDAHFVGIRSRTQLTAEVLEQAHEADGDRRVLHRHQPDRPAARRCRRGVPVFNAPFSNTRSVAELVLAEIIMLMRGIPEKNAILHRGGWVKSAAQSYEVRGKTLGIVGYGHIGTQIGVLAEQLGMRVDLLRHRDQARRSATRARSPSLDDAAGHGRRRDAARARDAGDAAT